MVVLRQSFAAVYQMKEELQTKIKYKKEVCPCTQLQKNKNIIEEIPATVGSSRSCLSLDPLWNDSVSKDIPSWSMDLLVHLYPLHSVPLLLGTF